MEQNSEIAGRADRGAGVALAVSSILSVAVMAHHPSHMGSGLGPPVHAAMIVLIAVSFAAYIRLASRCDLRKFSVLAGLVLYSLAATANVFAATINGFVAPALHARAATNDVMRLCWELNQALAFGAVYGIAGAIAVWSAQLVRVGGFERLVGIAGIVIAGATATLLLSGSVSMNVAGALWIYTLQALFGLFAGVVLLRRPRIDT